MGYKWANFIMKKITLVAMAVLCTVVFTDCAAKKPVKKAEPAPAPAPVQTVDPMQAKIDSLKKVKELRELEHEIEKDQMLHDQEVQGIAHSVTTIKMPCIDSSYDDEEFFRDLGIGVVSSGNIQSARRDAVAAAKSMIKARLGEFVQGVTKDYFNSYAGSKPKDDVERKMASDLNGVVEKMLNDADKVCEDNGVDYQGNERYYYAIQIPKKDLKKQMIETLSADEKLGIDFREDQMQKFMDERMAGMLEAKKAAGY